MRRTLFAGCVRTPTAQLETLGRRMRCDDTLLSVSRFRTAINSAPSGVNITTPAENELVMRPGRGSVGFAVSKKNTLAAPICVASSHTRNSTAINRRSGDTAASAEIGFASPGCVSRSRSIALVARVQTQSVRNTGSHVPVLLFDPHPRDKLRAG